MKKLLILTAGIAIGVGVSWTYHKNKYEQLVQEDITSVREHMNKKRKTKESNDDDIVEIVDDEDETDKQDAEEIINVCNYTSSDKPMDNSNLLKNPFVITPDEFATIMGYDTASFYYTSDNKVTDDNGELIEDVVQLFGMSIPEIRAQFGIYEEDVVYFRDAKLKMDYEILYEEQEYKSRN